MRSMRSMRSMRRMRRMRRRRRRRSLQGGKVGRRRRIVSKRHDIEVFHIQRRWGLVGSLVCSRFVLESKRHDVRVVVHLQRRPRRIVGFIPFTQMMMMVVRRRRVNISPRHRDDEHRDEKQRRRRGGASTCKTHTVCNFSLSLSFSFSPLFDVYIFSVTRESSCSPGGGLSSLRFCTHAFR